MTGRGGQVREALLLAALGAGVLVEVAANESLAGSRAVTVPAALAVVGMVGLRRRRPLAAAVATGLVLVAQAIAGGKAHDEVFGVIAALLVLSFAVAAHLPRRPAALGGGVLVTGLLVAVLLRGNVFDAMLAGLVMGGSWLGGRVAYRLAAQGEQLRRLAVQLADERDRGARDAVLAERARVARDLHDVVAHHVSVMVVQAGGARGLLPDDPGTAAEALRTIEGTGRTALQEMRRLLGVLRSEDQEVPLQPQTLSAVEPLLGPADRLRHEGPRVPLEAGLDLAAYRIVQEALTNCRRHGAGPATVVVTWAADRVRLSVTNDLPATAEVAPEGHGLRGMRERAALYDGVLDAGPDGGRWRVTADLPIPATAARGDTAAAPVRR